jgi:uncharacterized protein YqjF (DUF2071 family)
MPTERPFLTAKWTELLLLNFAVPATLVARLAPAGTEPDLFAGQAYASVVGFRFHHVRLFGWMVPGHSQFAEINLRYYVRRFVDGELRRGVVFVKEIAPRRAVGTIANWFYNENYCICPMRTAIHIANGVLDKGDTINYRWRTGCWRSRLQLRRTNHEASWNCLAARVAGRLQTPAPGSLEEFIIEHYWGYVRGRDGHTREYRVLHEPWKTAPADNVTWQCHQTSTYDAPWSEQLAVDPVNAIVADGSPVQLYRGRRI